MCVNCVLSNGTYYYIVYEAMHVDLVVWLLAGLLLFLNRLARLEYQISNTNITSDANSHDTLRKNDGNRKLDKKMLNVGIGSK